MVVTAIYCPDLFYPEKGTMGYTHYFETKKDIQEKTWHNYFIPAVKLILKESEKQGIEIAGSHGEAGTIPEFTSDYIMFNGLGEDAHETMTIERRETHFYFCKTARKPYDAACVAVAILAAKLFNKSYFEWSSDGDNEPGYDLEGIELVKAALGIKTYGGINYTNLRARLNFLTAVNKAALAQP